MVVNVPKMFDFVTKTGNFYRAIKVSNDMYEIHYVIMGISQSITFSSHDVVKYIENETWRIIK